MSFGKLSEGTKETVSLAFRLAVLDHLFPRAAGSSCWTTPARIWTRGAPRAPAA